jgi:hypothetical protein
MLLPGVHSYAQVDSLSVLFKDYSQNHLQEKIFAHTDKENYVTGEILWFKLYVSDAHLNLPLKLSKVAYVELLNASNKPVFQTKIDLQKAMGDGSFLIPYTLPSGNYIFRGYTSAMKNNGASYFFEKQLTIINPLKKPDWSLPSTSNYQVQFFPEGGNLVNGIESKIGFKITDQNGLSVEAKGFIEDADHHSLVQFETKKFGMGQFLLKPLSGGKYQANISIAGKQLLVPLPEAYQHGCVMRVSENKAKQILVEVESTELNGSVDLMIHTRQLLKTVVRQNLINGKTGFLVPNNILGDGISQITIFDAQRHPLCERLYFKPPTNVLHIQTKSNNENLGIRQQIELDIKSTFRNKPVAANLSLSAYLIDSLQSIPHSDILSYLWLESDLIGEIESPQYYFSDDLDVPVCTENLLLTQGWRRFKWEEIFNKKGKPDQFIPEWNGQIILAKVVKKNTNQVGIGVNVYLSIPAERPLFYQGISNQDGLVVFNIATFYGSSQMILQTNGKTDSIYRIEIIEPFSKSYSDRKALPFELNENLKELLKKHSIQSQVGNIYYPEQQQNFRYPDSMDTIPFYGKPSQRYYLDDYTRFITMEEVLKEYVEGIRLRKSNDLFNLKLLNETYLNYFETEPMILLDGVPVFDVNQLISFDPLKIKKIDVFNQQFFQNNISMNGILSCYTYQGDLAGYALDLNALAIAFEGLQLKREFYHPIYEDVEKKKNRLPDFRNVLSWIPDLAIDANGFQKISFFSSDIKGKYLIVVQGVGSNGTVGATSSVIDIK